MMTSRSEWKFRQGKKWVPFRDEEREHFLALEAGTALEWLDAGETPVVIKRGGSVMCSSNVCTDLKRRYQRVAPFGTVLAALMGRRVTLREMMEE